jgi:hypothetical protein
VPISAIKPPPSAPPPSALAQNAQRPPVEGKRPLPPQQMPPSGPPRPSGTVDNNAAAKDVTRLPPGQKQGAISMFEEDHTKAAIQQAAQVAPPPARPPPRSIPGRPQAPGSTDSSVKRNFRPPPPKSGAVGIPEGQPLPPNARPPEEMKAPPPTKPPPLAVDGGRAPPKEAPEVELARKRQNIVPPSTEPPLLRVKKTVDEKVIKRREKDMPEYESSDEDEEPPQLVKQPLPFGVLKGEIPPLTKKEEANEEMKGNKPDERSIVTGQSNDKESVNSSSMGRLSRGKSVKLAKPKEVALAPAAAPPDIKQSEFVPSAPAILDMDKHFDDSTLGKLLSRGRLSIKCIEGLDIRRKDDQDKIPRNDPFLKFRLGVAERLPWKTTETKRKQDSNPKFDNEIIFFDVVDPLQFIFQEDVQLCIELWNNSITRNELIGSVSMSVVRFFKQPFVSYTEKIPVYYPGVTRSSMRVSSWLFLPVFVIL